MAGDVAEVLESEAVGIMEAGTGTGKSLAYLLPAALWALRGNRRVVVSTRTINLQEQILHQDLPILEEALGIPVRAALVYKFFMAKTHGSIAAVTRFYRNIYFVNKHITPSVTTV